MLPLHHQVIHREPNNSDDSNDHDTVFQYACAGCHPELVLKFITKGNVDVNFPNSYGQTPLHLAAINPTYPKKDVIQILVENGADLNMKDKNGYTALHTISDIFYLLKYQYPPPISPDVSIIECFLRYGADPNTVNLPIISLDLSTIECLLRYGADPNTVNKRLETPLMSAASFGDLEVVTKFLDFGANVHLRTVNLETCLHIACGSNYLRKGVLEELVKHGACFYCLNLQGKTALDILLESNKPDRLKNAKTLIKISGLVNWKHMNHFLNHEKANYLCLIEYFNDCIAEIIRLKTIVYSENFTLYNFALGGCDAKQCHLTEEAILSDVLVSLWDNKFPIYHGTIRKHFDMPYLFWKLSKSFHVRNEESNTNVFLNEDILKCLSLKHKDLFNLAVAFANPPN